MKYTTISKACNLIKKILTLQIKAKNMTDTLTQFIKSLVIQHLTVTNNITSRSLQSSQVL